MPSEQNVADQDLGSAPEVVNLNLPSEYDTSPEVLHTFGSEHGLRDNQNESYQNIGREPPKGKIWGMKRKTFMIMLGIFILLIIAVAAGVGVGVAVAKAKNNNNIVSESAQSEPRGSSIPTHSSSPSPTSSSNQATPVTGTSSISSSPTPTPIRNDTPLAAVGWNTSNIQLLYKHTDGSIRLQETEGLGWGEQSPQITKPKDDSGLAAIGWLEGSVRQVRVYTVGGNNSLKESSWNSTGNLWYDRDIPIALDPPAAGSYLTAYTWFIGQVRQIRVYYQGQDGYIREAAYDFSRGWVKSAAPTIQSFPRAKSGSGLVVVSFPDTDVSEAKLFYQNMDGKLVSYDYQLKATFAQSWQNQDPTVDHGSVPDGTHLTAVAGTLTTGELILRIYFIRDGKLVEIWWTQKAGWVSWNMHDAAAPGISAVYYSGDVYVFFQDKTEYLSAVGLNGYLNKWQFTAII